MKCELCGWKVRRLIAPIASEICVNKKCVLWHTALPGGAMSFIRAVKATTWQQGYWACEQEGGGHNAANPYTEPAND